MSVNHLSGCLKGWRNILSSVLGTLLLLLASVFYFGRKRTMNFVLLGFFCLFSIVFIHDLSTYCTNGRPLIPFYEQLFGLVIPRTNRNSIFSTAPFRNRETTVTVTHIQRGNYAISIWIPEKKKDFSHVGPTIFLTCRFVNKSGEVIFEMQSENLHEKIWTWCRGKQGGSSEVYCIYEVPKNIPFDEELRLQIIATGEVASFLKTYTNSFFIVQKYADK